ncbi:hypothetical protein H072_1210 [Dactylellina haptotyla CBS 200.50]|uniref:Enoyl-CoA hydratase n=1 Tax=Dactylellina haptotyla (strain CBS 200.50) TaxID=1284197 RepID=S8APB7_DACHA|nr:hypothetical protein H072_1210 [Dactylellina haptotyla CBS 200.50]
MSAPTAFQTPPPETKYTLVTFPTPHIVLVTINRPNQRNSLPFAAQWELHRIWTWYDSEPALRCAIITGAGPKAFCAGQDLIELGSLTEDDYKNRPWEFRHPPTRFGGISGRGGKKPIIAAVNGFAFGGGFEIVLNCDMTVASPSASFSLPEALRGIYAAAGGLPRLANVVGLPVATEIALTGRVLSAKEALDYKLINKISTSADSLIDETIALAKKIEDLSPDAVIVTRAGLREAWKTGDVEAATKTVDDMYNHKLMEGENRVEGLSAFAQKRKPVWRPSKL